MYQPVDPVYGYESAPFMLSGAWITFWVIFYVIFIIAYWRIYVKAGEAGWKSIIPIWNTFVLFRITWGKGLYFLLLLIPFVNVVISIITAVKLAKVFGKGIGFTLGLIFINPVFILILAFGGSEYQGISKES